MHTTWPDSRANNLGAFDGSGNQEGSDEHLLAQQPPKSIANFKAPLQVGHHWQEMYDYLSWSDTTQ